jgi:glycosyltransferase involved in cell wall biosynthesis
MKKILILNYEFPPLGGGASPVSYEIAERMSKTDNFDIDVVTMSYKNLPRYQEINKNFRIHRVKCLRSKKEMCHPWEQATYLISGWFKCKELLRKNKYDICHCHFIIPTGVLALRLKKRFNLPYIITSHGSDVLGYNNRFKLIYPFLVKKWKNILDNANKIISPSNFLKTEILNVYSDFDSNKIRVISNGIDINKFVPQKKKKYIFSSGRLLVNKGFQYLIRAVSEKDIGYEVHIAGDGPMMEQLKNLAKKSKTKIVFHGWLDNNGEEYKNLLERSAIYVLASEKENASVSLLEAMSAGCAVITTNISGCPETVGDSGLIFEAKNHIQLKEEIDYLISNESIINNLGEKSRQRVLNYFNWDNVIKEYLKVLEI